jgi:hypothetical protein
MPAERKEALVNVIVAAAASVVVALITTIGTVVVSRPEALEVRRELETTMSRSTDYTLA